MATITTNLKISQNDYGKPITFTLYESDGTTARNLTGYTATFKVWTPGSPTSVILSGVCTVDSEAGGICHYQPVAGDFPTVGLYNAEIELTASGVVDSIIPFTLEVQESA